MCEQGIIRDVEQRLSAANICYHMLDAKGIMVKIGGCRVDNGCAVVLYADKRSCEYVVNLVLKLAANPDFMGCVYAFFPNEDFAGELEPTLFGERRIKACIMPVCVAEVPSGEIGLCRGKMLASRDEFTIKINANLAGQPPLFDKVRVVEALADLMMRVKGLENADCKVLVGNLVAKAVDTPVPLDAMVDGGVYCLKDGVRSAVMQMINNITSELEYKYEIAIAATITPCEPCVENDMGVIDEVLQLAQSTGCQVRECEAVFASHPFGYLTRHYPSVMYYCCDESSACGDFLHSLVRNILNR